MEANQHHTRHTSSERVEWLTREKLQAKDKERLDDLDRERVAAMRTLTDLTEMSEFKRVFDYAVAQYVSSSLFDGNSKTDRKNEALDLATIRQLLDEIEVLKVKEDAITEPYLERWRAKETPTSAIINHYR